jgi:hypothetical protein
MILYPKLAIERVEIVLQTHDFLIQFCSPNTQLRMGLLHSVPIAHQVRTLLQTQSGRRAAVRRHHALSPRQCATAEGLGARTNASTVSRQASSTRS